MSANDRSFCFHALWFRDEMMVIKSMMTWGNIQMKERLAEKWQTQPAGQSVFWKYKAIYRQGGDRVGQWSDVVSIPVADKYSVLVDNNPCEKIVS